jgi:hypothetical protein
MKYQHMHIKIRVRQTRNPHLFCPPLLLPLSLLFTKTIKLESACLLLMFCSFVGLFYFLVTLSNHYDDTLLKLVNMHAEECESTCTHIHRHVFILMWKNSILTFCT